MMLLSCLTSGNLLLTTGTSSAYGLFASSQNPNVGPDFTVRRAMSPIIAEQTRLDEAYEFRRLTGSSNDPIICHISLSMGMSLRQEVKLSLKQELSIQQRLQLAQQLALKHKLELKQVVKLLMKLCPELKMIQGFERSLSTLMKRDKAFANIFMHVMKDPNVPTALELQRMFPELRPVLNQVAKAQDNYGPALRMGLTLAPRITMSAKISLTNTAWNPLKAWDSEQETPCKLPKVSLNGIDKMSLDQRFQLIDLANQAFHFVYARKGKKKYVKIPLFRNRNVSIDDIAIDISKAEYTAAVNLLEAAGGLERIARAVPYSEIRSVILSHLEKLNIDLENTVVVGVDRGGRLPAKIVKDALGKSIIYFFKVDQGCGGLDVEHLDYLIKHETLRGKYVLFIDSTVDSGRQISALSRYFDDPDFQRDIGHTGWIVVGSNENGNTLDRHLNINWGVDPDETFEDDPRLLGVDYAPGSRTKIVARPSKSAREISDAFRQVPKGIILSHPLVEEALAKQKSRESSAVESLKAKKIIEEGGIEEAVVNSQTMPIKPTLGIIGNGKHVDITTKDAKLLALKLEGKMKFVAGTVLGNPGHLLKLLSKWGRDDISIVQPNWSTLKQPAFVGSVKRSGDAKLEFRNSLISSADVFLAIGGNEGTLTELGLALASGKPVVVNRYSGLPGKEAENMEDSEEYPNLHVVHSFAEAATKVREIVQKLK